MDSNQKDYQPLNNNNNININEVQPSTPQIEIQPPVEPKPQGEVINNIQQGQNQQIYNQQPQEVIYQPPAQVIYQPQPLYGQNIIVAQPQPLLQGGIVINQNQPIFPQQMFLVNPVNIICPFCKQQISTTVETQFSCAACCICCLLGVFYFLMQAVRGKDLMCNDATHRCPNCNNVVGQYQCL